MPEDRRCPAVCCSRSGVVCAPSTALEHSATVTLTGSAFCCCSLSRERVSERRNPPDEDRDIELMSAKSPDDSDCPPRVIDTGLSTSSCVSHFSWSFSDFYSSNNHIIAMSLLSTSATCSLAADEVLLYRNFTKVIYNADINNNNNNNNTFV